MFLHEVAEMLKFPRKKGKTNRRKGECKERREGRKGKKKERKVKGLTGVVYWERRRKCGKSNKGTY